MNVKKLSIPLDKGEYIMKKIFAFCCAVGLLTCSIGNISTFAAETSFFEETVEEEPITRATGLITNFGLSIWKSGSTLYINANTISTSVMKTIGFKDIVVEYRTSTSDWVEYKPAFDYTISSARECYMDDYPVPVTNGYYYRVTLNHYAKESGWFGSSQSVSNISNVVS